MKLFIYKFRILHGERSVWPLMAFIRTRCMIELALDRGMLIKSLESFFVVLIFMYSCVKIEGHERRKRASSSP